MAVEGRKVSENVEPANGGANGTATAFGAVAPSCYRVSMLSGSLEVSARLKSADDLELLVKVLEAHKALFANADRSANKALTKADWPANEAFAKADRSAARPMAKAERPKLKDLAKAIAKADPSEAEVLTLTERLNAIREEAGSL